jgi:predicted DNA binding protein
LKEVVLAVAMPKGAACPVLSRSSGHCKLIDFKVSSRNDSYRHLVELDMPGGDVRSILARIREARSVRSIDVTTADRHKLVAEVVSSGCDMCKAFSSFDCFVMGAYSRSPKEIRWRLLLEQSQSLQPLVERLEGIGLKVGILSIAKLGRIDRLTTRQEEVLRASIDLGYFDYPRKLSLKRLAEAIGVAPGSLSETLRRAEKNAVSECLKSRKGT